MQDTELQRIVEDVSWQYFNKPFKHRAYFNTRLRSTGGRYLLGTHNIEVNKRYYDYFGIKETIGIIKHELCHYHLHLENRGYKHGDEDFRELLRLVDAPRFCKRIPSAKVEAVKMYVFVCEKCKLEYRRKRRMNVEKYRCGKCGGKIKNV